MKKYIEKVELLERIIVMFAENKKEQANDNFKSKYGYDLRESKTNDYLVFSGWDVEGDDEVQVITHQPNN